MTLQELINVLRMHVNDQQAVNWPDNTELLVFLDRATDFITQQLIAMKEDSLKKPITIENEADLPNDFVAFVGKYPVRITGNHAVVYQSFPLYGSNVELWDNSNIAKSRVGSVWKKVGEEDDPTWKALTTNKTLEGDYWSRLPFPSSFELTGELPYTNEQTQYILTAAAIFTMNKNEYELTQDQNLLGQMISSAMKARGIATE